MYTARLTFLEDAIIILVYYIIVVRLTPGCKGLKLWIYNFMLVYLCLLHNTFLFNIELRVFLNHSYKLDCRVLVPRRSVHAAQVSSSWFASVVW